MPIPLRQHAAVLAAALLSAVCLHGQIIARSRTFPGTCTQGSLLMRVDQANAVYLCGAGLPAAWLPLSSPANMPIPAAAPSPIGKLAPYLAVTAAAPGTCCLSNAATQAWTIDYGLMWRTKWAAVVNRVRFSWQPSAACSYTGVYIALWREDPNVASGFDMTQRSENLLPRLHAGINDLVLATPLVTAQGDLTGTEETGAATSAACGGFSWTTDTSNVIGSVLQGAPSTTQGLIWSSAPGVVARTNQGIAIELYTAQTPQLIGIGDSLMSGYPQNRGECDGLAGYGGQQQPANTITAAISAALGWTADDCGWSGQTSDQILARFASDVVSQAPQAVLIEGGINDLNVNNATAAHVVGNFASMVSQARAAGIRVIILGIVPGAYTADALMTVRDQINAQLAALAAAAGAIYVDPGPYVGLARSTGPPGNLWNLQPAYDSGDHEHPSAAGYLRIGQAVADALQLRLRR